MIKEAIEYVAEQAKENAHCRVMTFNGERQGVYHVSMADGVFDSREIQTPWRVFQVADIPSLCRLAVDPPSPYRIETNIGGSAIFVDFEQVELVFDVASGTERAQLMLQRSMEWGWAMADRGPIDHDSFLHTLRFAMRIAAPSHLYDRIKAMRWSQHETGATDRARGRESLGAEVINEASAQGDGATGLPEDLQTFGLLPYANLQCRRQPVQFYLDPEPGKRAWWIVANQESLDAGVREVRGWVAATIKAEIKEIKSEGIDIPIYQGAFDYWRPLHQEGQGPFVER